MNFHEITLPHADGPEKSVLSSILKNPGILARARADGLTAEHFGKPAHAKFFGIMADRVAAGSDLELVAFFHDLQTSGELDDLGGAGAITEIFTYAPNTAHFDKHFTILRQEMAKRRAMSSALDIVESGHAADPEDLAKQLRAATDATNAALRHDTGILTAKQAVTRLHAQMLAAVNSGEMPGLPTGLGPIDIVTGGMRPGDLWVVAALPSEGKSVVMLQAGVAALKEGKRVLVISLEMGSEQVIARMVSCWRAVTFSTFMNPRKAGGIRLNAAKLGLEEIAVAPLSIHDRGGLTFDQIAGIAKSEADRHGKIDLVVVDYLQLVEGSGRRKETREQEVASVSRGLKGLAKSLGCPIFTASQLNDDGRMRESRAIGQDADVVLIIQEDGIKGLKVRSGQRGQLFPLKLNGELQRFETASPTQTHFASGEEPFQ